MPTYEYQCIECETKEEILRSFSDPEIIPPCQKCGYKMQKVYGTFGINLKGKGFYSTDNRKWFSVIINSIAKVAIRSYSWLGLNYGDYL